MFCPHEQVDGFAAWVDKAPPPVQVHTCSIVGELIDLCWRCAWCNVIVPKACGIGCKLFNGSVALLGSLCRAIQEFIRACGRYRTVRSFAMVRTKKEDSKYYYQELKAEDKDFIDYWWRLLFRYFREAHEMMDSRKGPVKESVVAMTQREDYEMALDELKLMKDLERMEKREAELIAAAEYASLRTVRRPK